MKPVLLLAALLAAVAAPACRGPAPLEAAAHRYTCPMHPAYTSDHPGNCPICGMKLVPLEAAPATASATGPSAIHIEPDRRRLLGIELVAVRTADLAGSLRTVGRVVLDETTLLRVQPRFEGYIEQLDASTTGMRVTRGQRLASIYSPELWAAQQELLLASRSSESLQGAGLAAASDGPRTRLRLLGISDRQIAVIEATRTPLRTLDLVSPASGYVVARTAVAGGRVTLDQPLFEIADLRRVWVLADVYESELSRVAVGQSATVTLPYGPGRTFGGRVAYLYPTVDDRTRTVKVRIVLDNPRMELRPEMFVDVVIAGPARRALAVPEDAVIDSGTRTLVFVDVAGPGEASALVPREVRVGGAADGLREVLSGLGEGERVATGASFLLDSESHLRSAAAALRRKDPP
jgi:Cu(I)/Ag(I) efflux system membrane fusion protein